MQADLLDWKTNRENLPSVNLCWRSNFNTAMLKSQVSTDGGGGGKGLVSLDTVWAMDAFKTGLKYTHKQVRNQRQSVTITTRLAD